MAFSMHASMLHCPVSMPLGIGRKDPAQPRCGQQLTLQVLERKPGCGPPCWPCWVLSGADSYMPGGVLSSKSSLPHLFLPQMQGRLMVTLFTSKFGFVGGGVSYSYRRRKVRKPRKCFPTSQGYLLPFLFLNSSYNVSSWLIVFDLDFRPLPAQLKFVAQWTAPAEWLPSLTGLETSSQGARPSLHSWK